MSRQSLGADLRPSHSWVWTADAERRWLRAFRLLLVPEGKERADCLEQEDEHGKIVAAYARVSTEGVAHGCGG